MLLPAFLAHNVSIIVAHTFLTDLFQAAGYAATKYLVLAYVLEFSSIPSRYAFLLYNLL